MPLSAAGRVDPACILIADDEPDIDAVTRLSLKGLRFRDQPVAYVSVASGVDAVAAMRRNPDIAVILLDVVMETTSAGLDACRAIRRELGNRFVRILLRTGQPGSAPERQTIDDYDIDGYLPKAELTSNRLYSAVRTALRAWDELVELERHRKILAALHEGVVSLHSFDPLPVTLSKILELVVSLQPTALAVLHLETFAEKGDPRRCSLHLATEPDALRAEAAAAQVVSRVSRDPGLRSLAAPREVEGGVLVPLVVHRELGYGWIYLEGVRLDAAAARSLPLLAAHAANALYSSVAETILKQREDPIFATMTV